MERKDSMGQVVKAIDPMLVETRLEYKDPLGRVTKTIRAAGTADEVATEHVYDTHTIHNSIKSISASGTQERTWGQKDMGSNLDL